MAVTVTYSEFITFLTHQSKTHNLAAPYKQSTHHTHKANFDSFINRNDDTGDDDDSVLKEVIAHISI